MKKLSLLGLLGLRPRVVQRSIQTLSGGFAADGTKKNWVKQKVRYDAQFA